MPGFDGTGPEGFGPGTGWGRGPCGRGMRRGFGRRMRGFGRGLGYGRGFGPQVISKEEEKQLLEEEQKDLLAEIDTIKKRLKELE